MGFGTQRRHFWTCDNRAMHLLSSGCVLMHGQTDRPQGPPSLAPGRIMRPINPEVTNPTKGLCQGGSPHEGLVLRDFNEQLRSEDMDQSIASKITR